MGSQEQFREHSACPGILPHSSASLLLLNHLLLVFLKENIYLLIYLAVPGFSCSTWDLVPGPPALGVQSLSHWTTSEVPPFLQTFQLLLLSHSTSPMLYFPLCASISSPEMGRVPLPESRGHCTGCVNASCELSLRLGRDPGRQNTGPKESWFLIAGT